MIQKVLKIFKVNSINRLIIIFIVFAITGSLSVILGEYVLLLFFSDDVVKGFFYWVIRILIIFPLYQILLIIIGSVFGEFKYFWSIEKKILKRLKIIKSSSS
jgi:hypothetical protein|tara:strand:- start:60 stop:365 length:306 start_codon:yes stop_codon:yes gene_type:complete